MEAGALTIHSAMAMTVQKNRVLSSKNFANAKKETRGNIRGSTATFVCLKLMLRKY